MENENADRCCHAYEVFLLRPPGYGGQAGFGFQVSGGKVSKGVVGIDVMQSRAQA
jgi:hypothetical protein